MPLPDSLNVPRRRYLPERSHEQYAKSGRSLTVAHQFPVVLGGAGAGPPSFGGAQPSTKVIEMVATVNTIRIPRNIFIPLAKGQREQTTETLVYPEPQRQAIGGRPHGVSNFSAACDARTHPRESRRRGQILTSPPLSHPS